MDTITETAGPENVGGRSREHGGSGDTGGITALGVFAAITIVCRHLFGVEGVQGRRVLVQGVGHVGAALARRLLAAGADVSVSDVDPRAIDRLRRCAPMTVISPDRVYDTECDVFAPCALGGVINEETLGRLRCRAVVGGANCQLRDSRDGDRIHRRGIFYAPDFVVNMGGALGGTGMDYFGWSIAEAETRVVERVQTVLKQVLALSQARRVAPETAARQMAEDVLKAPRA